MLSKDHLKRITVQDILLMRTYTTTPTHPFALKKTTSARVTLEWFLHTACTQFPSTIPPVFSPYLENNHLIIHNTHYY